MKISLRAGIAAAWIAITGLSHPAWSASPSDRLPADGRLAFEVGVENFQWQEYDDNGQRLLTEQGPRLNMAALVGNRHRSESGVLYGARVGGFGGDVNYDGQDSNGVFTATTTAYQGWIAELTGGWRSLTGVGDYAIDLFGSVGAETWERDILGNLNANGQPVAGFLEEYDLSYGKVGLGLARWHSNAMSYLQLGLKRPFSIDEDVRINGQELTLAPGLEWSGFASYKISFDASQGPAASGSNYVMFYYDTYRFSKSSIKSAGTLMVWQPKSNMDRFGVMVGYAY